MKRKIKKGLYVVLFFYKGRPEDVNHVVGVTDLVTRETIGADTICVDVFDGRIISSPPFPIQG